MGGGYRGSSKLGSLCARIVGWWRLVSTGYRLEFTSPPPSSGGGRVTPIPQDPAQREALEKELQDLLCKEAVTRTTGLEGPLFLSSFFLAPKKNNSWRPILNLKPLNTDYIRPQRFRMETLAVIIPTLRRGMWAASIDLKDAYLHIQIAPAFQRYLSFSYKGSAVQVYGTSLRPIDIPTGLHPNGRCGSGRAEKAGSNIVCLHRRLAHPRKHGEPVSEQCERNDQPPTFARLADQLGEVASHPDTVTCLLGRDDRPYSGKSFPDGRKIRVIKRLNPSRRVRSIQPGQGLVKGARTPGKPRRRRALVPTPHAAAPVPPPIVLPPSATGPSGPSSFTGVSPASPFVVDSGRERRGRDPIRDLARPTVSNHRSVTDGLGGLLRVQDPFGGLDGRGGPIAHQSLELEAVVRAVRALADLAAGKNLTVFSDNTTTVTYINRQGGTRSPTCA